MLSCINRQPINNEQEITITVSPDEAVENIKASELYADIHYIPLETRDDCLIGEVSDLIKYKNRFYILDKDITYSVFCFDESGKFLFKINNIGTGPGEYVRLTGFSINTDNDQLVLFDGATDRILLYSLEGKYIESYKLGFHANEFSYMSDGFYAFYAAFTLSNNNLLKGGMYPNLIITNEKFEITKTGMQYSENANFAAIPMSMKSFNSYDLKNHSLMSSFNDTIFSITPQGEVPYIYIDFKNNQRTQDLQSLMYSSDTKVDGIVEFLKSNDICDLFYFVESKENIFFSYSKGTATHYFFYNKETMLQKDVVYKKGKQFPIMNDIDGIDYIVPMIGIGVGNLFYTVVSPDVFLDNKDEVMRDFPEKQNLINLINKVSEEDNPIIAVITPN